MDLKTRIKNPWFWAGIIGVILTAIGADPQAFTSWGVVWESVKAVVSNPYMLVTAFFAVVGVFVEPTTSGLKDKRVK